jgi:hypothetical protein
VIQSAINAVAASGGGRIFIRAGTYYAQNINTKSFVEIYGEGIRKTVIRRNADYPIFNFKEKSGTNEAQEKCVLADLTLDAGGYNNTYSSNVVEIDQLKDSGFYRLHFRYPRTNCFYITGTSTVKSFWNIFEDIFAETSTGHSDGALFVLTQYAADCWVRKAYTMNIKYVVYSKRCGGGWTFRDLWGVNCQNTVYLSSDDGGIYGLTFDKLWVDTPAQHGIYIHATVGPMQGLTFRDVYAINLPANYDLFYIEVDSGKFAQRLLIDGIHGTGQSFRYIVNKVGAGTFTEFNIRNNMHFVPAGGMYNGFTFGGKRSVGTGPYYVTENSGTATFSGNGSQTQFTIPHGLAGTPRSYRVEAGSSDAKGDKYVTADDTNLTVTFATAPPSGANNVVLVWQAEM